MSLYVSDDARLPVVGRERCARRGWKDADVEKRWCSISFPTSGSFRPPPPGQAMTPYQWGVHVVVPLQPALKDFANRADRIFTNFTATS